MLNVSGSSVRAEVGVTGDRLYNLHLHLWIGLASEHRAIRFRGNEPDSAYQLWNISSGSENNSLPWFFYQIDKCKVGFNIRLKRIAIGREQFIPCLSF